MTFKKTIFSLVIFFLASILGYTFYGLYDTQPISVVKPHTVLVVLEALPGKESQLKDALMSVKKRSLKEPASMEYRVHQDLNNPTKFFLYENWASKEAHTLQFEKPYIIEFAKEVSSLLAKPYDVIFAEQL